MDIEAPVLKDLRELQGREGGTLGELVSRLLAEALDMRGQSSAVAGERDQELLGAPPAANSCEVWDP